jgi:hypothetical protein
MSPLELFVSNQRNVLHFADGSFGFFSSIIEYYNQTGNFTAADVDYLHANELDVSDFE